MQRVLFHELTKHDKSSSVYGASPYLKKVVNAFNWVEKDREQEGIQAYGRQYKRHWIEDDKQKH